MSKDARRVDVPMQTREAPITSVNKETRTVELVWSTGARVRRYDWWREEEYMEELSMDPAHVRMGRLQSGAPLLNTHSRWSLADVLGVVESATVDGTEGRASVRFSEREDVQPIFNDVQNKIVRNVSAGYVTHRVEILPPDADSNGLRIFRAVDWEPMEISLVPIGADAGAGVRSKEGAQQQRTFPCEYIDSTPAVPANTRKEQDMTDEEKRAAAAAKEAEEQRLRKQAEDEAADKAKKAEQARVQGIRALCTLHKLTREFEDSLINDGACTLDQARAKVLDKLAEKTEQTPIASGAGDVRLIGDEGLVRRGLMVEAMFHRIAPASGKISEGAGQYRYMSLLRLAEEVLTIEGHKVRGLPPMEIASRAMLSTSDFPNILADVANKRLRASYEEQQPSYQRWARRAANAPDFKNINVTALSAAPELLKVLEGGEFKYGTVSDGKETYAIVTYGRILPLTRQAIINDDLNAFDRLPRAFSGSARRLENYLVYQQLLSNPAMSDSVALFHATHGNLPTAAAITAASLGLARACMRKQTGLASEKLNLSPKFLLAGADKEQEAYQYTSAQFVPAQASNVNEFRQGGRTALEPIIDNEITGNKWFLAADNAQCDTVEYAYLEGSEGVWLESRMGFNVDGVDLKARLDFVAKVVDYRGLVYNSGA